MRIWMFSAVVVAVGAACFVAGQVSAEEEDPAGFEMPEWTKVGPEHAELAKWVGDWDVKVEVWMQPDAPPMESMATCTYRSLWEGRFIESDFAGDMMGASFTGRLLMGYDRVDKQYVAVWIDSMSAYMSVSRGAMKDGVITLTMNDPDWMTGKKKESRLQIRWTDKSTACLTFQEPGEDGSDRTTMRMTYTRKAE